MAAVFLVFWSFALSIAVVLYTLTPLILLLATAAALLGARHFRGVRIFFPWDDGASSALPFKKRRFALPIFFLLYAAAALCLFFWTGVSSTLQTPWQGIYTGYLPVFFLLTAVLGFFLLAPYRVKTVLVLIILHSLLQHLYLPASHVLPWGGDVWRHIAVEEKLSHGEIQPPGLPEALIIPHKYTYGQLWGVSAGLSMATRLPLTEINRWLMPILWSVALPLLLFQLGVLLFNSRRWALALAVLPAISFPFQALGALTLPVSLGFLTFLFALFVWFRALETGEKKMKLLALMLAALMAFGYALYVILLWFIIGITWICKYKKISPIMYVVSLSLFPAIELLSGFSRFPASFDWWHQAKQFIGQFSGWYYASAIRPHDILSGNIFFNHTPSYAFVENFFTAWRWWMIPVVLALWGVAAVGFFKSPKTRLWQVLQCCSVAVFGGYVIGWYVLEGDRLFTRRLDLTLAFLAIIFFLQGIQFISQHYHLSSIIYHRIAIIIFAFFATATYASGPDLRVVSGDEYEQAQYAWTLVDRNAERFCILADTWVLLPLEAISQGKIVGGGFPIDRQFGQPDRMRLYEELAKEPDAMFLDGWVLAEARKLTGTSACVFVP